jgi:hypothetical protein
MTSEIERRTDEPAEERVRTAKSMLVEGRHEEAIRFLTPLAESGMPQAQLLLGWTFEAGYGQARVESRAKELYQLAADQGYPPAEFYLAALHHRRGETAAARTLFERAASHDFPPAYYRLALTHMNSREEHELELAAALLRKAEAGGHLPSAIRLRRLVLKSNAALWSKFRALCELTKLALSVIALGTKSPHDERLLR